MSGWREVCSDDPAIPLFTWSLFASPAPAARSFRSQPGCADPPSGRAGRLLFFGRGFQNLPQFQNPIHGIGHPHHPSLHIFTLSRFAHQEHEQRIALDSRVRRGAIGRIDTTGVMLGLLALPQHCVPYILLPVDHHGWGYPNEQYHSNVTVL